MGFGTLQTVNKGHIISVSAVLYTWTLVYNYKQHKHMVVFFFYVLKEKVISMLLAELFLGHCA